MGASLQPNKIRQIDANQTQQQQQRHLVWGLVRDRFDNRVKEHAGDLRALLETIESSRRKRTHKKNGPGLIAASFRVARHPDQAALLRSDPERYKKSAAEEVIRHRPGFYAVGKKATRDIRTNSKRTSSKRISSR